MATNEAASDYSLAITVAKFVELRDVLLKEIKATTHVSRDQILEAIPWTIDYTTSAHFTFEEAKGLLMVRTSLGAKLSAKSTPSQNALATVECAFDLAYWLSAEHRPKAEERDRYFQAFANVNGIYNVWPYFRELVHSTVARMGLPPLIIPVYRVSATRNVSTPARSQTAAEKRA
jgi:hypothetical protein